jgi:hypothetical protein
MTGDLFQQPVGALARTLEPLRIEESLELAAQQFRHQNLTALPVVNGEIFAGVLREGSVLNALAEMRSPLSTIAGLVVPADTISVGETGAEAARRFERNDGHPLVVLNAEAIPIGMIAPRDLFPRPIPRVVPPMVGGMATPFGVYLTTGSVSGGAGQWGLFLSGAILASMFLVGDIVTTLVFPFVPDIPVAQTLVNLLPLILFAVMMRLMPLAGTHAAEHQVVNALERGETLEVETVKRMSRIHPRCGTNLAGAASLFTGAFHFPFIQDESLRFLIAVLVTVFFWRPVGTFLQWAITTKPASDDQIRSGIKAADELIANYAKTRRVHVHPMVRIFRSGMLHAMAGGMMTVGLAALINRMVGSPMNW